jgi:hypothetical protein
VPELPAEEPLPATRRRRRRSAVRHQGRTADLHSEELDAPESLAG